MIFDESKVYDAKRIREFYKKYLRTDEALNSIQVYRAHNLFDLLYDVETETGIYGTIGYINLEAPCYYVIDDGPDINDEVRDDVYEWYEYIYIVDDPDKLKTMYKHSKEYYDNYLLF